MTNIREKKMKMGPQSIDMQINQSTIQIFIFFVCEMYFGLFLFRTFLPTRFEYNSDGRFFLHD